MSPLNVVPLDLHDVLNFLGTISSLDVLRFRVAQVCCFYLKENYKVNIK